VRGRAGRHPRDGAVLARMVSPAGVVPSSWVGASVEERRAVRQFAIPIRSL